MPMPVPKPRHGEICSKADRIFGNHAEDHDLGRVLSNDSGVITAARPRHGARGRRRFLQFRSRSQGPCPMAISTFRPTWSSRSFRRSDRWPKVLAKVAEYLDAGTSVVVVLDDERRLAHVYPADGATSLLTAEDELTIPDLLGDFRVRVGRFFE